MQRKSSKDNRFFTTSSSKQSVSNLTNNSTEGKLLVTQTEAKARGQIAISRKRQELEKTETMYAIEEANGKLKLTVTEIPEGLQNKASNRNKRPIEYFSQSMPDASNQKTSCQRPDQSTVIFKQTHFRTQNQSRSSTSYLKVRVQTFIPKKLDTPPPKAAQTHHRKIIITQAPFKTDWLTKYNAVTKKRHKGIDEFIDHLVDGQETNIRGESNITPAAMLQW